jgi:hypothetical protein
MDTECDCVGPFRRNPECRAHDLPARQPELVGWRFAGAYRDRVHVAWDDEEGIRRVTTLDVEHDLDGASFHYRSGDRLDANIRDTDSEFHDMLSALDSDMSAYEGSKYIPIRPYYYRPELKL